MFRVVADLARRCARPIAAAAVAGALTLAAAPSAKAAEIYAGIVIDVKTGNTLYQDNADALRYPASLTKMMTLYIVFEELESGRLRTGSRLNVSANAAAEPPTRIGVRSGQTITVENAILALITRSANDVATVIAENIGGSETAFARRMTDTARALGMSRTTFRNAHGLPNSAQVTTARDMAKLGQALWDRFPTYFRYFSTRSFRYNGVTYGNHNNLLGRVDGVNGIKTGYTRASGYNLVTSVSRNGRQIIAVVLGGRSGASRDAHMIDLIDRYLPRATTGARTAPMLVASIMPRGNNPYAVPFNQVPAPRVRPGPADDPIAVAAANVPAPAPPPPAANAPLPLVPSSPPPVADIGPAALAYADPLGELLAQGDGGGIFLPGPIPTVEMILTPPAPIPAADARAAVTEVAAASPGAAPAISPDAWKIQIGAMPNRDTALSALERARDAEPTLLADMTSYTEPVERNGDTLYRARFAGFIDQGAAQAACAALTREDFACIATR